MKCNVEKVLTGGGKVNVYFGIVLEFLFSWNGIMLRVKHDAFVLGYTELEIEQEYGQGAVRCFW